MIEAAGWGLIGASSLLLGSLLALVLEVPVRIQGLVLAFGAGVLFGAVAYELVEEAIGASMTGIDVGIGFAAGAVTFYAGSLSIDRLGGASRRSPRGLASRRDPRTDGLAIVLGTVLDGIPESVVLGASLLAGQGVGLPILVAVFLSNVPEALGGTEDLVEARFGRGRIIGLWATVVIAGGVAAALGFGLLGDAPLPVVVAIQAFAAGAILTMLAESMIPEAYEKGGRAVGLATALGFAVAAYLAIAS
jgi:zinc transporter, ZIP family